MDTHSSDQSYRKFNNVISEVPYYQSFFSVAEHKERDVLLAENHAHVSFEDLGESSDGNNIWSLKVGEGKYTALMFAAPHPNEPIGSMTIDFLANQLAENDDLRDSLNYEFIFIKTIDIDGTLLNEGWFDGPFTISNYAQNFYRPASTEQVEWTFPIEYEDYEFNDPIAETEILMDVISNVEPDFIYSLHNAGFGGCYYYISHDFQNIFDELRQIPRDFDVPLHLGEPETPWATEFDDAIFKTLSLRDHYDFLTEETDKDPTQMLTSGGGSYDFAKDQNEDVVELITELPYFYDEQIDSDTLTDSTRRQVILEGVETQTELAEFIKNEYQKVNDELPDTRLTRAIDEFVEKSKERIEAKRSWAEDAEELSEKATVAQKVDALTIGPFYQMLYFGTFLRALDHAGMSAEKASKADSLAEVKANVEQKLHDLNGKILDELNYEAISIRKLVSIQSQAGLICLDYLQETEYFEP